MADVPPIPDRRYADAETAAILKRAAELQGTAEPPTSPTLTDLQQIADEAGIEPRYVRQAAAELASPSRGGGVGAPDALALQRVVAGELPAPAFDALVEAIRDAAGMAGHVSALGRGFTWTSGVPGHPAPPRALTVTVTAVDGRTVIRGDESLARVSSNYVGTGVASALMGGFGLVAASSGDPSIGVIAAAVAWAAGSLIAAGRLRGRAADCHRRDLAELLDRIAEHAQVLVSRPRDTGAILPPSR